MTPRGVAAGGLLLVAACRAAPRSPLAVADSLRLEGRSSQVVDRYRALRDSFAARGDTARWWYAQVYYGDALVRLGRRDSARVELTRAMALAAGDPARRGRTEFEWSLFYDRQGRFDSAFAAARRAQVLARTARDRRLEGSAYNAFGRIYSLMGRHRLALAAHDSELAIRRETGADPREVANALNEMGIDYRHLGRYSDAADVYDQALTVYRRLRNPMQTAIVLLNYANIRAATGEDDQALVYLTEAKALADSLRDPRGRGLTRNNLADLHAQNGDWVAARRLLLEALAINTAAGQRYGIVTNLENLGRAALAEGRPGAARDTLGLALALADAGGYGTQRALIRAALARAAAAAGDGRAARAWAAAASRLADSLGDPEVQYEALAAQSVAARAARLPPEAAVAPALRAIDLLESVRGRIALGDLRMGVSEPRLEVYETAIRTLVETHRPAAAFAVAERARARLLLELMSEREAGRALRSREDTLRQLLRDRSDELAGAPPPDRAALAAEIGRLESRLGAIEDSSLSLDPAAGVDHPAPATAGQASAGLAGPDRALLAYFWGDSAVYGWWVGPDGVRAARLGAADSLASLVDFLRSAIERPDEGAPWRRAAARAYRAFVAPLRPSAAGTLLLVPDGPLAYLPFEVLLPDTAAAPWGATRRVVYGPSAGVLLALAARRSAGPPPWDRAVLAVGNPAATAAPAPAAASRGGENGGPLAPLPYAEQEAAAVTALFQAEGADLLVGRDATLQRWLAERPDRYRYLHFAAHARIDDRRPDRTGLALAGGALDVAAIRRVRVAAELVTLSGCETALGRRVRGEGVIGLPHAFLAAGARAAVVTLWRVSDRSAADFMEDFYRRLKAGQAPADALGAVRRAWIARGGAAGHPSQWAPFILVGDGTR